MIALNRGKAALICLIFIAMLDTANTADAIATPDNDPFYTPSSGYASQPNGAVLKSRRINAEFLTPLLSTRVTSHFGAFAGQFASYIEQLKNLKIKAYQVLFKSTNGKDRPLAEAATILVPQGLLTFRTSPRQALP